MIAISLWQPWAQLVALGAKRIETRSWAITYRGPIAIHAAKHFGQFERRQCWEPGFYEQLVRFSAQVEELPLGAVVAVADVVDCVPTEKLIASGGVSRQELQFGDYRPERWGWVLENVIALDAPVPAAGKQGLWHWEPPGEILETLQSSVSLG